MNRTRAEDARVIAQMTRWTLVMLQNAEQGLVPVKALQRAVDPAVLAALGPIQPPQPGQPRVKPRAGRLRMHLVHDELAHVACAAGRPDGPDGRLRAGVPQRAGAAAMAHHELSRVEERRIIGPGDRHEAAYTDLFVFQLNP